MSDDLPPTIGEPIEEILVRIVRPDLLKGYQDEKERHRQEKCQIEWAMKRARAMRKRLFGPQHERKEQELETAYVERIQQEDDRHDRFLQEFRQTIRDDGSAEKRTKPGDTPSRRAGRVDSFLGTP